MLLLVYHPGEEFFLSEIARQVGTTPGTARRELNRLKKIDFVSCKKRGNLSVYQLNSRFPLLPEIESIIRKTCGIEEALRRELAAVAGIRFAFIFGSYAARELKSGSDIDFYVIGDPDEDALDRAVEKVQAEASREINYHISSVAEFARKARSSTFIKNITAKPLMVVGSEDDLRKLVG